MHCTMSDLVLLNGKLTIPPSNLIEHYGGRLNLPPNFMLRYDAANQKIGAYLRSKCNELTRCARAGRKFYGEGANVIIIGDDDDGMSAKCNLVPAARVPTTRTGASRASHHCKPRDASHDLDQRIGGGSVCRC